MIRQTKESYLDRLFIGAPCSVPWDSMQGDDRVRDCSMCSRKVYNISDMARREAEDFLRRNGASQCMRFYRRPDGKIMTDNCPVALRKLRNRFRAFVGFVSSIVAIILSLPTAFAQRNSLDAYKPPQAPPGMEYYPNPAGGGFVLKPATHDAPGSPKVVITNYKDGQPAPVEIGRPRAQQDSNAFRLYLRGKEFERHGNALAAALCYRNALTAISHQKSFDPGFKQLIEKNLQELRRGTQSQP